MRVARMGYAQRVVKKDKKGRVTQSFMRVRIEVPTFVISELLPEPHTGLRHLTEKVANEREHAEWTARFQAMIEEARSWLGPRKTVNSVRVPLAPQTTHALTHMVTRGGFGSHFVPADQALAILAEQQERARRQSETTLEPKSCPAPPPRPWAGAHICPLSFATTVAVGQGMPDPTSWRTPDAIQGAPVCSVPRT
jgi:hypothetical protein